MELQQKLKKARNKKAFDEYYISGGENAFGEKVNVKEKIVMQIENSYAKEQAQLVCQVLKLTQTMMK